MKIPWLSNDTLGSLTPQGSKALIYLCDRRPMGMPIRGQIGDAVRETGMCRQTWRRACRELGDLGLIAYATTTRGYEARVTATRRFTWVPTYTDGRLMATSERALKALLCICRALDSRKRTVRMGAQKLSERMGRSVRTAMSALAELRDRQLLNTYRTGRSSWMMVHKPERQGRLSFERPVADQPDALLHILLSYTPERLSRLLSQVNRRGDKRLLELRNRVVSTSEMDDERSWVMKLLRKAGVGFDEARTIVATFMPEQVMGALERMVRRRIKHPGAYLWALLERGVC